MKTDTVAAQTEHATPLAAINQIQGCEPTQQAPYAERRLRQVAFEMQHQEMRRRLVESDPHYRSYVENINDILFALTPAGTITYVSPQWKEAFGHELSEVIGQTFQQFVHPEDISNCLAFLARSMETGEKQIGVEYRALCKNGTYLWYSVNGSFTKDPVNGMPMFIGVGRDINVRKQTEEELGVQLSSQETHKARQRMRQHAAQIHAAREKERIHIAREVHDELGQVLTALRMDLSLLSLRFGAQAPALIDQVQRMKSLVDRAIMGVRNVAVNLHPSALDFGLGLRPALEWLCTEFTEHTTIACALEAPPDPLHLGETRSLALFRIVQESLTNIARYAHASQVSIIVGRRGNALWLEVRDNGRGFDPAMVDQKKSFGLLGMQERALALGGELTISSSKEQGTIIRAQIPRQLDTAKEYS